MEDIRIVKYVVSFAYQAYLEQVSLFLCARKVKPIIRKEETVMLDIKNVSIDFSVKNGTIRPVDGVCLKVENGIRHLIVGETGSGKSVLLMSILGLSGGKVQGEIYWNGRDLLSLTVREMASLRGTEISYIPQGNANGLNPLMKNGTQIGEPLAVHHHMGKKEAFEKAVKALKRLDFSDAWRWARQYPHNLSGGMKQRALVAMGTIAGSSFLLADEPTKGLDDSRRGEVEKLFTSLESTTLLCVTHDLDFAKHVAHRISVMYAGQIVETADKEDFFKAPLHPYSKMLIQSLPENGFQFQAGFAPSHDDYSSGGCRFVARCQLAGQRCTKKPPLIDYRGRKVQCWNYAENAEIM